MSTTHSASDSPISRRLIGQIFFLLLMVVVFYGVFRILQPYLHAIIMAGLLASTFFPVYTYFVKRTKNRQNLAALAACTVVALLVVVPLSFCAISLVYKGYDTLQQVNVWIENNNLERLWRERAAHRAAAERELEEAKRAEQGLPPLDPLITDPLADSPEHLRLDGHSTVPASDGPAPAKSPAENNTEEPLPSLPEALPGPKAAALEPVKTVAQAPSSTSSLTGAAKAAGNVLDEQESRIREYLQKLRLQWLLDLQQRYLPWQAPNGNGLQDRLLKLSESFVTGLAKNVIPILQNVISLLANFVIMLFVMFYFFRDGEFWLNKILQLSPMSEAHERMLIDRVKEVAKSAILGTVMTAAAQGVLGMVAFAIVGIPWLFWGVVMGIASMVPVVGTAVIWVPGVIYLLLIGKVGMAIFLLIWCVAVVGLADNFLRPMLMEGDTGMSSSILFFAILGGVQLFGLAGVIYGPMIFGLCAVLLIIWDLETSPPPVAPPAEDNTEMGAQPTLPQLDPDSSKLTGVSGASLEL